MRWFPADPITLKTSLRIAADVVEEALSRRTCQQSIPWGRAQDLAFEQPVGNSPKQRHHVHFGAHRKSTTTVSPCGAGTTTWRVEISRTTGGITHRISPDVDSEREKLIRDTGTAGDLALWYWVNGFHQEREGERRWRSLPHRRPFGRGRDHCTAVSKLIVPPGA